MFKPRIPKACFGILFFCQAIFAIPSSAGSPGLAVELLEEGFFADARREALRALLGDPGSEASRELLAAAERHLEAEQPDPARPALSSLPGRWVVSFYRTQIRPAIGHRCSLSPSCSEYFRLASERHGWLGVPLLADRLFREPGIVERAEIPVPHGRRIMWGDPLEDHTFWLDRNHQRNSE